MSNLEILVHIRASCRVRDDRKYREIANGALSFEPVRTILISGKAVSLTTTNNSNSVSSSSEHGSLDRQMGVLATTSNVNIPISNVIATNRRKRDLSEYLGMQSDKTEDCSPVLQILTPSTCDEDVALTKQFPTFEITQCATPMAGTELNDISRVTDSYGEPLSRLSQMQRRVNALEACVRCPNGSMTCGTRLSDARDRASKFRPRFRVQGAFMPTQVARAIQPWERGHWLFPINITIDPTIAECRTSMNAQKSSLAGTDLPHDSWTLYEFLGFWDEIKNRISLGDLGFVSLYRDGAILRSGPDAAHYLLIRLRLYCWGEVASHVYLAVSEISAGLLDHIVSRWTGSDGRAVISIGGMKNPRLQPKLAD